MDLTSLVSRDLVVNWFSENIRKILASPFTKRFQRQSQRCMHSEWFFKFK